MKNTFPESSFAVSGLLFTMCAVCSCASSTSSPSSSTSSSGDVSSTSSSGTASGSTSSSSGGDAAAGGATSLTGTLGTLGAVQPTVSSFVISNSGETLVYMSSSVITCEQIKTSRWLGGVAAGAQVVEIVVPGAATTGRTVAVPPGEVNYAAGGRSSSYEVNATGGSITFTKVDTSGAVEGTVRGTYASGNVSGNFKAEFCAGGQGF